MANPTHIDAAMCERLVNAAHASCQVSTASGASASLPAGQPQPEWDALANSFASLSAALAWGSILLAIIALIIAIGWGLLVKVWAEREAQKEAAECVKKLMEKWLAEEAPGIIRQHVENIQNASLGDTPDDEAADEMGKEAG